jgi:AcrR family transcriptional regulator
MTIVSQFLIAFPHITSYEVNAVPKQTFFNLPEDKRSRILDAAMAEIGSKPFEKVSVSDIIEKAEIPRGSFYQYFDDLKDLYRYILQVTGDMKLEYISHVVGEFDNWPVFKIIRELYNAGLKFAAENPRLAAVGNFFFREDISLKKELFPDLEDRGKEFFETILTKGQERGEIDPAVDIDMAAFILYSLTSDIMEYYLEQAGPENDLFIEKESYLKLVDKMLYIIETGLKNKNQEHPQGN